MKDLLERGEITPIIDRFYSLEELPDAFQYLENGHTRGKIVVAINPLTLSGYGTNTI
jgi:NADPH:quinone reductase-like Zn-dependent oxidoreductase